MVYLVGLGAGEVDDDGGLVVVGVGDVDVRNAAPAAGTALLHYHQYDHIYSGMRTQAVRGAPAAGTALRPLCVFSTTVSVMCLA